MSLLQRVLFAGQIQIKRSLVTSNVRLSKNKSSSSSSSDSDSSSDEERKAKPVPKPKTASQIDASNKLKTLLESMIKEETSEIKGTELKLAKPREKQRQKHLEEKAKQVDHKKFGEKLADAAKKVAEDIGGDSKQTETELLSRLLYKSKIADGKEPETTYTPKTDIKSVGSLTLNELLSGMKIDRSQPKEFVSQIESRANQVRSILAKAKTPGPTSRNVFVSKVKREAKPKGHIVGERVDLFGAERLGIFTKESATYKQQDEIKLDTWKRCFNKELTLSVTQPPRNIYEQMILWTNKGMMWHFPIDNEQGLEDEKKVPFFEHVHLERHLEGWCPDKGPIRHFMELVCVGLSKNPWLTVDEKQQHIWWFKDYFSERAKLIREIGAGEIKIENLSKTELQK